VRIAESTEGTTACPNSTRWAGPKSTVAAISRRRISSTASGTLALHAVASTSLPNLMAFSGLGMAVRLLVWRYRHRSLYWHTTLACV